MPTVMAQQVRRFKAKTAPEITYTDGYCTAYKIHYHGVNLQISPKVVFQFQNILKLLIH